MSRVCNAFQKLHYFVLSPLYLFIFLHEFIGERNAGLEGRKEGRCGTWEFESQINHISNRNRNGIIPCSRHLCTLCSKKKSWNGKEEVWDERKLWKRMFMIYSNNKKKNWKLYRCMLLHSHTMCVWVHKYKRGHGLNMECPLGFSSSVENNTSSYKIQENRELPTYICTHSRIHISYRKCYPFLPSLPLTLFNRSESRN